MKPLACVGVFEGKILNELPVRGDAAGEAGGSVSRFLGSRCDCLWVSGFLGQLAKPIVLQQCFPIIAEQIATGTGDLWFGCGH